MNPIIDVIVSKISVKDLVNLSKEIFKSREVIFKYLFPAIKYFKADNNEKALVPYDPNNNSNVKSDGLTAEFAIDLLSSFLEITLNLKLLIKIKY